MSPLRRLSGLLLALVPVLPACAGTEPAELTPVDELPDRYREMLRAYGAGADTWDLEREAYVADPELADFLVDNMYLEMVRAHSASAHARPGSLRGPFERARDELVRLAPRSTPVMVEVLATGDGIVASLAAGVLERVDPSTAPEVAALLERPERDARRRAAELLERLRNAGDAEDDVQRALAEALEADPEWIVRAQAAQTPGARGATAAHHRIARPALRAGLLDPDEVVAAESARALARLEDMRDVPLLIERLEDAMIAGRPREATACKEALVELTGETTRMGVTDWKAWWRANQSRVLAPTRRH
jgi:hypothetical protein